MVQVEGLEAGYKSQQAGEIHGASGKLDPFGMQYVQLSSLTVYLVFDTGWKVYLIQLIFFKLQLFTGEWRCRRFGRGAGKERC